MGKKILFMLAFALSFNSMQAQDAIDGGQILMHFPFDNDLTNPSSATTLSPKTGATITNFRAGKFGTSAFFNNTPYITSGSTFDAGADFTIVAWVKYNALTGGQKIIHQEEDPDPNTVNGRPLQLAGSGVINNGLGEPSPTLNSTTNPIIDEWYHIAVVMDKSANSIKIYINGVLENDNALNTSITVNNFNNNAELSIGVNKASNTVGLLNGYLDDFMITTEVLTENQVKAVMNLGVAEAQTAATNIWLGTSADFGTDTNWSQGTVPVLAENVIIPSGTSNNPTASAAVSAKNIVIQKNASLDVGTNAITATSTTVFGGGSLIAKATVGGSFTYKVITAVNNTAPVLVGGLQNPAIWNLLSSPVVGDTYDDAYILDNFVATGTGANRGIALYSNTTDADGDWVYHQNGATATFDQGLGFSTRKKQFNYQSNNEEIYNFIGTFPDADVNVSITQGAPIGNNWNLVGNPFPSYIRVSELMAAANGAGTNADNITDANETVYVWNPTTETYTGLPTTDYIQPGQGFFVNADNSTANNFSFLESLQSHQTGVTFYKNANAKITLSLTDDNNTRIAYINYNSNETLGLDRGKDIGLFTGIGSSLNVYTELLNNNTGIAFERQALPNSDFESMIIPLGVNAKAGKKITFSADAQNLPSGLEVYLEDRTKNTYTRISGSDTHEVTLDVTLNGSGRFYLHTSQSSVLNTEDVLLNSISIFKSNSNLNIRGLKGGKASIELYNVLGKRVLQNTFTAVGNKTIALPNLSTGMYIVKLQTEEGSISKKIILE